MSTAPNRQRTTLRDIIEHAAGYHIPPQTGTETIRFLACAAVVEAHGRCKGQVTVGTMTYICDCSCHLEQAEQFDALYGTPWWAEQAEAE